MTVCLALPGAYAFADTLKQQCQGKLTANATFVPIGYSNWGSEDWRFDQGVEMLDQAILDFAGQQINVVGYDMGARIVNLWLYRYGLTSNADPTKLKFTNLGDPTNRYTGIYREPLNMAPVNTAYQLKVITRQYDGYADAVKITTNQKATKNQWYGAQYIHPDYFDVDPNPDAAGNFKYIQGNITYVWVRTDILPMIQTESPILRMLGIAGTPNYSQAAREQDTLDRPVVESAMERPVLIGPPSWA